MYNLPKKFINEKLNFINEYSKSINPADGSKFDANANVEQKNIATRTNELLKDVTIQINREMLYQRIEKLYGKDKADTYIHYLNHHDIYAHDETSLYPYCVSINMYPFLQDGLIKLGGQSKAPHNLDSFCGSFINLCFAVSSQFAGALATVEFLLYFQYFVGKEYGDDWHTRLDEKIGNRTIREYIEQRFQQVVYSINQPAAARGYQCVRSDTTQLSTPEGFKYLHELKENDMCYVWKDGNIVIEPIKKLNVHQFDGELIQFNGRNYQQTVTPNHRVLFKNNNTSEYQIKEAHELEGLSKLRLPIASKGIVRSDYGVSDSMLKLCVAVLTDGTIENRKTNFDGRIRIYKSKNRYGYNEIQNWLNETGIGFNINDIDSNDHGEMVCFTINSIDAQSIIRLLKGTKKEIPHFFKLLSQRQSKIVIDEWSKFDGTFENTTNQLLQCDNDDIRNSLQEIAILAGLGSEIFDRNMKKYNSDEQCIVKYLKIFKRENKDVKTSRLYYQGDVWCPTTDAGVVIFREENGVPYISGNSIFWNISVFDKFYFESMFGDFVFPDDDMTVPEWERVDSIQRLFLTWFNKERSKAVLTFPVVTAALLTENKKTKDTEMTEFLSDEMANGNSFFVYMSDSADSLASCCRLRNEIEDNTFSYSLGAGGVATGSINVITLNVNRFVQDVYKQYLNLCGILRQSYILDGFLPYMKEKLQERVQDIQKFQIAYRSLVEEDLNNGMLTAYSAGFIDLDKQFLTIGINGFVEAAEFLGIRPHPKDDNYEKFAKVFLGTIFDENRSVAKSTGYKMNTEFVPAESLGVKNAKWDKEDGYFVPRDVYNSYFYIVEDGETGIFDKFILHGNMYNRYLDGGSALHLNLDVPLPKDKYYGLFQVAAQSGCNYWCVNIKMTICNECGHIEKVPLANCMKCGSTDVDGATRVIGYLKRVSSFSSARRAEEHRRFYSGEVSND